MTERKTSIQNGESVEVPEVIDSVFSKLIREIEYLPLRGSESHIMPEATKIRFINERIYIWNKEQHCISVYSFDGQFLFCLSKRGKAKGEYMEIAGFTVDTTYIYIVDNYKHEIYLYDAISGTYKDNRLISFVCWDIEHLDKNRFLCTYLPNNRNSDINTNQQHDAVWLTDSTFQTILAEYLPYDKDYYEIIGKSTYFSKNKDGVSYSSFLSNCILCFNVNKKDPIKYEVKFSKPIPSRNDLTYGEVVEQGYIYLSETPSITDKYLFLSVASHGEDETIIYDKTTKRCYMNDYSNSSFAVLPLVSSYENKGVAYLSDYDLYEELIADGFKRSSEECENILRNGGACLLFYTFCDK